MLRPAVCRPALLLHRSHRVVEGPLQASRSAKRVLVGGLAEAARVLGHADDLELADEADYLHVGEAAVVRRPRILDSISG
jgi:hypothetical protein